MIDQQEQSQAEQSQSDASPRQTEAILAGITRLPTLPAVATRLLEMGADEDVRLDEVIELIEADPALSARMLSLCRSADTGLGDRITTVRRAVIMLGLEAVRSAVLSVLVFDHLQIDPADDPTSQDAPLFDIEGFWTRAIAVACVSEHIVTRRRSMDITPDQAYLAGLVHALGKLALYKVLPKSWDKALTMAQTQHTTLSAAERATIGIDHHTAGKRLAEHWGLPDSIRDVIWLHNQLPRALPNHSAKDLVSVVTLACAWCETQHLGWSGEARPNIALNEIASDMDFEIEELNAASTDIIDRVSQRAKILGVGEFTAPELLLSSLTRANEKLATINQELRAKQLIADRSHGLLAAADTFYNTLNQTSKPEHVIAAIASSGATLTGIALGVVILQEAPGCPWYKYTVIDGTVIDNPNNKPKALRVESPPLSDTGEIRPGHIAGLSGDQILDLATLDWFREMIKSVREVGVAALIGVGDEHENHDTQNNKPQRTDQNNDASCLVVLVKAAADSAPELSAKGFRVIRRLWSRALNNALQSRASAVLSEELASANRELASMQRDKTQNESLLRLGQMAAGAAHEMNNPLSVINGRSQQLFERLGTQRDRESARAIAEAADSLSSMITSMHLLAEPPEPSLSAADPVLVVRQAIEQAKANTQRSGIRAKIKLHIEGTINPVKVDRDLMASAISEPIINAVLSNPQGVVMVSIEPAGRDGRILIKIVDTGTGLSQKALNHAFDPFFSELKAGRRPGLGLARARSIIELHAGAITINNTTGKIPGAQIQITLKSQTKSRRRAA